LEAFCTERQATSMGVLVLVVLRLRLRGGPSRWPHCIDRGS
jgi:hypothetical protein